MGQEPEPFEFREPLTVSSKGMEQHYDKTRVDILNKIGKPYGVKAEQIPYRTNEHYRIVEDKANGEWILDSDQPGGVSERFSTRAEAARAQAKAGNEPVWAMKITPEMRKDIIGKGFPREAVTPFLVSDKDIGDPNWTQAAALVIATWFIEPDETNSLDYNG